jgi:phosphohistidine phosphatase
VYYKKIKSMSPQKTLYILRHAKAEAGAPTQDDRSRALTDHGRAEAAAIGRHFQTHAIRPQQVLCSTALRACQTWAQVEAALAEKPLVDYRDQLYLASPQDMLSAIAATPDTVNQLVLVGHNPGLHQLCLQLATTGEAAVLDGLTLAFPTCALAAITFEGAWHNSPTAKGELKDFIMPIPETL